MPKAKFVFQTQLKSDILEKTIDRWGGDMRISRVVVKNYRSLKFVDVQIVEPATMVIGENNTGKSNFFQAIRLCLDSQLTSAFRSLHKDDVHCHVDQAQPFQVLVGVEFTDFEGHENEEALLHGTQIGPNRARIFYRFRPKRAVREAIAQNQQADPLTLEDYGWELFGGGDVPLSFHPAATRVLGLVTPRSVG